ncbi:serine protease 30 isoform X1 [Xenopus laevis]|uniref:Serine protease 30 isoform X1 n=1 Tax=Xenopus laevis TaxID=8355 RepID=A0A8J1LTP1_XENLA|nr:serine protease 30 isoform X1 [Xenopus laevis]
MVLILYNTPGCGKTVEISERIVGGQDAKKGKYPWQVLLWCPGVYRCGGSLVSNKWVVSAAHCLTRSVFVRTYSSIPKSLIGSLYISLPTHFLVFRSNASCIIVILGANTISGNENEEMTVSVKNIFIHPNYSDLDYSADIALVELTQNVSYTSYIIPVCLPTASAVFSPGQSCWVTGWGITEFNTSKSSPNTLQEIQMRIINAEQCRNYYNPNKTKIYITDQMICAKDINGGKDSCQGDSGGPLVCSYEGSFYLVGVVSFGIGCGNMPYPGVYTYVPAFRDWIGKYVPSVYSVSSGSTKIGLISGLTLKALSLMSFIHSLCWVILGDLWLVLIISIATWMRC